MQVPIREFQQTLDKLVTRLESLSSESTDDVSKRKKKKEEIKEQS